MRAGNASNLCNKCYDKNIRGEDIGKMIFLQGDRTEDMKSHSVFGLCSCLILCLIGAVAASGADSVSDAELVRDIEDHLIAPCCWTQPISEHESGIAEQMREEVRTMVAAGESRDEILDHFVAQYGERILATPRPEGFNLLVYILPWVALIAGAWILWILIKKLRAPITEKSSVDSPDPRYASIIEKELKEFDEK
jgi:cytochrome c-type biogenesis protein CcmH